MLLLFFLLFTHSYHPIPVDSKWIPNSPAPSGQSFMVILCRRRRCFLNALKMSSQRRVAICQSSTLWRLTGQQYAPRGPRGAFVPGSRKMSQWKATPEQTQKYVKNRRAKRKTSTRGSRTPPSRERQRTTSRRPSRTSCVDLEWTGLRTRVEDGSVLEAKQRGRPYSDLVRAAGAKHLAATRDDTERMAAEAHQREKEEEKHNTVHCPRPRLRKVL